MTLQAAAAAAAAKLIAAGLAADDARRDAALLARAVLAWDAARWLTHRQEPAPPGFVDALDAATARRAAREPIAYITGSREFLGRPFLVNRHVLIPRPDTELLVEATLARLRASGLDAPLVADVGTGSGCIALSLAAERPAARVVATDVSAQALEVARENARRLALEGRVDFRLGSMLAGLADPPDVLVSNPPYVRLRDRSALPPDVVDYEPEVALFSGDDGLDAIRALARVAASSLGPGAWLLFEMGADQREEVLGLVRATGAFDDVSVLMDLERRPRVVTARRSGRAEPAS